MLLPWPYWLDDRDIHADETNADKVEEEESRIVFLNMEMSKDSHYSHQFINSDISDIDEVNAEITESQQIDEGDMLADEINHFKVGYRQSCFAYVLHTFRL